MKIFSFFKNLYIKYNKIFIYGLLFIVGLLMLNYSINNLLSEISLFFGILTKVGMAGIIIYIFDDLIMKDVSTIDELRKGNVAYAIFLLGYMILVGFIILSQ